MSIKRRLEQSRPSTAFAAQVPPLGEAELAFVQRAMADIAPDWAVELTGICDSEASLIVVPDDGEDTTGPTFVINREADGLRLHQLHWDATSEIGVFASMNDVVQVLRTRLAFCIDMTVPAYVTLH